MNHFHANHVDMWGFVLLNRLLISYRLVIVVLRVGVTAFEHVVFIRHPRTVAQTDTMTRRICLMKNDAFDFMAHALQCIHARGVEEALAAVGTPTVASASEASATGRGPCTRVVFHIICMNSLTFHE